MVDAPSDPVVVVDDRGRRTVSWSMQVEDGPVTFTHDFPDAVRHHYEAGGPGEDLLLYAGRSRSTTMTGTPATCGGDGGEGLTSKSAVTARRRRMTCESCLIRLKACGCSRRRSVSSCSMECSQPSPRRSHRRSRRWIPQSARFRHARYLDALSRNWGRHPLCTT